FANVAIIAAPSMLKGRRTGNVVIAGSDGPLDAAPALVRRLLSDALPSSMVTGGQARAFGSRPVLRDPAPAPTE
ncbi:MAG: spermidine synthase, partial [Gordonia amarae]